jgi:hypothetical protein
MPRRGVIVSRAHPLASFSRNMSKRPGPISAARRASRRSFGSTTGTRRMNRSLCSTRTNAPCSSAPMTWPPLSSRSRMRSSLDIRARNSGRSDARGCASMIKTARDVANGRRRREPNSAAGRASRCLAVSSSPKRLRSRGRDEHATGASTVVGVSRSRLPCAKEQQQARHVDSLAFRITCNVSTRPAQRHAVAVCVTSYPVRRASADRRLTKATISSRTTGLTSNRSAPNARNSLHSLEPPHAVSTMMGMFDDLLRDRNRRVSWSPSRPGI